jgi:class 3 adenylate cyclase
MECSRCKATIPEGSKFCIECGVSVSVSDTCPNCQNINPPQAKFCGNCGTRLIGEAVINGTETRSSTPPPSRLTASSAERRQVTVMFCDLVGSTALSSRLDPEDLRDVIAAYHRCVATKVTSWRGFVAKYMGDGVLIYFGYPQAHEDDAERAVRAALAIIKAIEDIEAPDRLEVRVGIATGLVVVGDLIGENAFQEREIVGETPNLAARLQTFAEPGTAVIEPSTRLLVGELFDYRDLGEIPLKGFSGPVRAYEVIGASAVESRFEAFHAAALAPLVGRDEEIELLLRRWIKAKTGDGQVVLISGEPGIGKSRLAATIIERIGLQPHTRLRYFCSPHHTDSAFHPIIRQVERAAQLQRDDDANEKVKKLDALLSQGSAHPDDYRLIGDLLSLPDVGQHAALHLSPQQRRQRTIDAFIRQLEGLAQHHPVLQIFEDVHWADPTSLDLLNRNIERIQNVPALLLITFRPEFNPPWVGEPHVSMMALGRLGQRNGAALIEAIAGDRIPPETVSEIIDRTDGVPLFVEELTKSVLEAGIEGHAANSALTMVPSRSVPASLHASLMARLDRLGSGKELAQIGAAIGREFSYELLAAVSSDPEAALRAGVKQIIASGLVLCRGTPPESSYLFKHALVQDAAYGTLLRRTRQHLHARIAEVLETQFPDQSTREPEVLGRHFSEAQRPDRASGYWLKAGRQAAERSANLEAIRHLSRALDSLKMLPESPERDRQELIVQSAIGTPLTAVHGYAASETGIAFSRARELGARLGDAEALFSTLSGQWTFHCVRGDHEKLRELTAEAQRRAREMHDEMLELAGYRLSGLTALYFG